ncbi:helix-turn-helix transcriptional regulator [Paracraurococcus ruber]|uniref:Helix-turn-helix transcriptional regulator n=1 Tax=Paracraurococcus ruber TaxID=77675 RepID=A0ABS1D046_9PROT|nr:helix-turn-helix transcriptional regulator [Paracraurococcus ruber]MBK1659647.1 helix-turn-helix transcriptional regulator [Paracraurococcus ruber]TDG29309.1 helix-turn-helix transcriptional regulator [Paracraurococcus ruber]
MQDAEEAQFPTRHQADHRQLQQLVTALTEGVILVNPDETIAWANPRSLEMHGVASVAALGHTVSEYRARFELRYRNQHRLPAGAYPMERILAGEAFDEVVVQVAPAGEEEPRWTHRIRSLALTDAEGKPDCLAVILSDETERYDAEERFERTFNANPAPAVILRLGDFRYVKVNAGFLELTGLGREEVVGRSLYERDVLEGADRRDLAIERLGEGRTIPQMEASLRLADGGSKLVIVAGQPIEIGEAPCMLFTFADLEPRRRAEALLRQSEERFAKAFRLSPVPMAVAEAGAAGPRFVLVNDAFRQVLGHAEAEILGRTAAEHRLWEDQGARRDFERLLAETGHVRNFAARLCPKEGGALDCLVSAEAVDIQDRPHALLAIRDVTEQRRTEADIVAALEAVMRDTSWFSHTVLEALARLRRPGRPGEKPGAALADITGRRREVLGLVCDGLDNREIARQLGLSLATVRNHVNALYAHTDVHSRAALVVWARERGFTGTSPPVPRRKSAG